MWNFIVKISKKLLFFIVFFQQKKIFLYVIILLSITIVSCNYLYEQDLQNKTFIYDKFVNESKSFILNIKRKIFQEKEKNDINYVLDMLELSKKFIETDQYDQALYKMINALNSTSDKNLTSIINLRIARMYLQQKQVDLAMQHLQDINSDTWMSMKYNLIGDAMLIKKDTKEAIKAWEKSMEYNNANYIQEILLIKINNAQNI